MHIRRSVLYRGDSVEILNDILKIRGALGRSCMQSAFMRAGPEGLNTAVLDEQRDLKSGFVQPVEDTEDAETNYRVRYPLVV
jgi:hypothetical protein